MEGKKLTPEEYLERRSFGELNKEEKVKISDAKFAVHLARQENQSQLKEIRDKVERLSSPYKTAEWYIKISDVLEILKPYIYGE